MLLILFDALLAGYLTWGISNRRDYKEMAEEEGDEWTFGKSLYSILLSPALILREMYKVMTDKE